jgi:hypothetical protein
MNSIPWVRQKCGVWVRGLLVLLICAGARGWATEARSEVESLTAGTRQVEWQSALGFARRALPEMGGSWLQGRYQGVDARVWIGTSPLSSKPGLAAVRQEWVEALNAQRVASPGILISDQGCAPLQDGAYLCRSESRMPASGKRQEEFLSQALSWNPGQERVLIQSRTFGSSAKARSLLAEFKVRPRLPSLGGKKR